MSKKKILKNKELFGLLSIYTFSHIFFYSNNFYLNFLISLFWLIFLLIFYQQNFLKLSKQREINITLIIAIIFLIIYLTSGFILGFNNNLVNYSLINIFIKVAKVILPIWGMEIIRYKLLSTNNSFRFRALITIMIILSEINFKALWLSDDLIFFHYFIAVIMPLIAQNILFTYLSINSHYNIPIIIKMFEKIPKIFLPIIPYSNWFIEGAFAIIKVLIIYYLFKYFIFKSKNLNHFSKLGKRIYPLTIITAVFLVLFMLGLFSYQPLAILSNSMKPTFERGDVIIYKKNEEIELDDIIVFQYQEQLIVHRVVGINEYYVTKGDANNSVDNLKVKKEDIKGVYQFHLKYLGYPAIWLNELLTKEN